LKLNQILKAIYATYITNYFGFKLKGVDTSEEKKQLRIEYAQTLLGKLKIEVVVKNREKLPKDGQFLLTTNHRSVIDPLIVELALRDTQIFGHWVSKKELYDSFFFGVFVRNGGTILLDREDKNMSKFFIDAKKCVKDGNSIFIFPEGTRNKTKDDIIEFKDGSKIIALKNRLPILPLYIRDNANEVLMGSLKDGKAVRTVEIEIGDVIDYKDRTSSLYESYLKQFNLKRS
jgi:1-acyl-sn-glycerol-3-phosphate acyltransferase